MASKTIKYLGTIIGLPFAFAAGIAGAQTQQPTYNALPRGHYERIAEQRLDSLVREHILGIPIEYGDCGVERYVQRNALNRAVRQDNLIIDIMGGATPEERRLSGQKLVEHLLGAERAATRAFPK